MSSVVTHTGHDWLGTLQRAAEWGIDKEYEGERFQTSWWRVQMAALEGITNVFREDAYQCLQVCAGTCSYVHSSVLCFPVCTPACGLSSMHHGWSSVCPCAQCLFHCTYSLCIFLSYRLRIIFPSDFPGQLSSRKKKNWSLLSTS